MRRFLLPLLVLAIAIAASILAGRANDAATPTEPASAESVDSLGTPLLSVRRIPEWLRQPSADNALDAVASAVVNNLDDQAITCLAVHRDGTAVAEVNSAAAVLPGDLHRIVTLGALDALGGTDFTTEVVRSSAHLIEEGVLQGDLWVLGGGDPTLSTDLYSRRFDPDRANTSLSELALLTSAALAEAGITAVDGSIIGVDTKYDGSPRTFAAAEWPSSAVNGNEVGGISSLLVNNGFSEFPVDEINAELNTRASNPTAHAAREFLALLAVADINVSGGASAGDAPEASTRVSVATLDSSPLSDIAERAGTDATTAEMLYRETTQRSGRLPSGTFDGSAAASQSILAGDYLPDDDVGQILSLDGSGISPANRSSCGLLTAILDSGENNLAVRALPAGADSAISACLPSRLPDLRILVTERNGVTAMAGRTVAENGDVLTFSAIANWLPRDDNVDTTAETGVCAGFLPALLDVLAEHPIAPRLDKLVPLPVVESP
ncbi:MAG: D-alanyl-D-alanine carboxypeptidase/D-alanyl-D-alanine-endopeptidase (penicillin-binding protein 4) [Candidatus Aldehydirespiratoraceae bacterium]|jgi:D-alanyl-D-alanine carboxypeptidase/D-alanyl-D-alanine-endopeptidase (penicillin-binding protein 4)